MTSKASQTGQRSVHFDKRRPQTLELELTSNSVRSNKKKRRKRKQQQQQQNLVRAAEIEAGLIRPEDGGEGQGQGQDEEASEDDDEDDERGTKQQWTKER